VEGIAGWEGDAFHQGYGFVTAGLLPSAGRGWVLPVRVTASYLYYDYRTNGVRVAVRSPGVSTALGVRLARSWGTVTLLSGGEVRWERRERGMAPGPAAAVARGGLILQGEADLEVSRRIRQALLLTYSGSSRYLYGRAAMQWQCTNLDWRGPTSWFLGIEGVGQGNHDTDAVQAGGVIECTLVRARLSLSIHGGYKDSAASDSDRRRGGYFGAGLYRRF
jgi:hypothetical protein